MCPRHIEIRFQWVTKYICRRIILNNALMIDSLAVTSVFFGSFGTCFLDILIKADFHKIKLICTNHMWAHLFNKLQNQKKNIVIIRCSFDSCKKLLQKTNVNVINSNIDSLQYLINIMLLVTTHLHSTDNYIVLIL